jgi:hypothetical protein
MATISSESVHAGAQASTYCTALDGAGCSGVGEPVAIQRQAESDSNARSATDARKGRIRVAHGIAMVQR